MSEHLGHKVGNRWTTNQTACGYTFQSSPSVLSVDRTCKPLVTSVIVCKICWFEFLFSLHPSKPIHLLVPSGQNAWVL